MSMIFQIALRFKRYFMQMILILVLSHEDFHILKDLVNSELVNADYGRAEVWRRSGQKCVCPHIKFL